MTLTEQPNSQNLHEATFQTLKALLVEGKIAPGSKLNERELAESLHVSRTPIREAIRRLAADGLVELIANRGAIAVQLSIADVIHTFDVIAELEGYSGELAAKNINDSYFLNSKKASNDGLFTPDSFHPANNDFQSKINDRSSSLNFISNESDVRSKSASNSNNS